MVTVFRCTFHKNDTTYWHYWTFLVICVTFLLGSDKLLQRGKYFCYFWWEWKPSQSRTSFLGFITNEQEQCTLIMFAARSHRRQEKGGQSVVSARSRGPEAMRPGSLHDTPRVPRTSRRVTRFKTTGPPTWYARGIGRRTRALRHAEYFAHKHGKRWYSSDFRYFEKNLIFL